MNRNLSELSLDAALDQLEAEAASFSRRQVAAFYGVCGRKLLFLYEDFVRKYGFGDLAVFAEAATKSQSFAMGHSIAVELVQALLLQIEEVIPDGEYFDAPDSTFAQDVAICFDAAVRAIDPGQSVSASWVQYVMEPAIIKCAERQTGLIDPGQDVSWRETALSDFSLRKSFESAFDLISKIKTHSTLTLSDFETLGEVANGLV